MKLQLTPRTPRSAPSTASLLRDERGLSTVEYIILMVIIVVGCVGIWNSIGSKVVTDLTKAEQAINDIGANGQGSGESD